MDIIVCSDNDMFSILIYIVLPIVYLIHDIEEVVTRRNWESVYYDKVITKFPKTEKLLSHLREMNQVRFTLVVVEQFLLLIGAILLGIYVDPILMVAIFWGFCIHLFIHVAEGIAIRGYVPGLVSSVLLIPYCVVGIIDLSNQYTLGMNILLAVFGFVLVVLNLLFAHYMFSKS